MQPPEVMRMTQREGDRNDCQQVDVSIPAKYPAIHIVSEFMLRL